MSNYIDYQKSVACEFDAYKNRVRNIIGNSHWGEEGRHKETVLINYLKRVLPNNVSVGTGFVKNGTQVSKQIDIIIYDTTYPMLFSEGDFVIVIPESVLGIIEVKSNIWTKENLKEYISTANSNAHIICGDKERALFNGIFSYEGTLKSNALVRGIEELDYSDIIRKQHFNQVQSNKLLNCVNHIVYSNKILIKLCPSHTDTQNTYYGIYEMPHMLSIGYFISNLQNFIFRYTKWHFAEELPEELKKFLFPLPEGKETYLTQKAYINKGE